MSDFQPPGVYPGVARLARTLLLAAVAAAAIVCSNPSGPSGSPETLAGVYRLRVEIACNAIPASDRVREYFATIDGSTGTLSGGTFWTHPNAGLLNRFTTAATASGWSVNFTTASYGVLERTSAGTYLEIAGIGTGRKQIGFAARGTTALTGTLNGSIRYGQDLRRTGSFVPCPSASLTFVPQELPAPPPGVDPVITGLTIVGPTEIAPRESVQLQLMARLSDDSTREIKDGVTWRTSRSDILQISPTGVITGGLVGSSIVTALVARPNTSVLSLGREMLTLPTGTFRLSGKVTEAGAPDYALGSVRVEVEDGGAATGLSTTTNSSGFYQLYGVAGRTRLRLSRDGYQSLVTEITIGTHQTFDRALTLTEARRTLAGRYQLTVTASSDCAGSLPEALRRRTFGATVVQAGPRLNVTLDAATFLPPQQNHFSGSLQTTEVQLEINGDSAYYYYYYYPNVIEQVTSTVFYSFDGRATLTHNGELYAGTLDGRVAHLEGATTPGRYRRVTTCQSASHRIELR